MRPSSECFYVGGRPIGAGTVDSSIASRLTYMDFSEETRQRFTDVAEAMLSVNAGAARAATGAL